ncbi:DUF2338 family protein [Priestia megaterium]|nr:DUF2338 family protein [Priestia megaterium]
MVKTNFNKIDSVLLVGAGPAAIQAAINLTNNGVSSIGIMNRSSAHTDQLKRELIDNSYTIKASASKAELTHMAGSAKIKQLYENYEAIEDAWDLIMFCTPNDVYQEVVHAIPFERLTKAQGIILLAPGIGDNQLVKSQVPPSMDVISISTYYAATKFANQQTVSKVITKAVKKRLYVSSCLKNSEILFQICKFIKSLSIECMIVKQPVEAEARSITMYVHPPLFLTEFSLAEIFKEERSLKFMYKLYPEGPITQHVIRSMVLLWKEISALIEKFNARPVNLLKFLNDDNYPVHEVTLSRNDIENFMEYDQMKQEYLLYIRYSAILIDPFSTPDEHGRYFDFSAVSYIQAKREENGYMKIPRIPLEDYKKVKFLYKLGKALHVTMPEARKLIAIFEAFIQQIDHVDFDFNRCEQKINEQIGVIINEMKV